ncbi:hypothetical protein FLONG3_4593 [Fusarium longipes]|uniref:DNA2/NAM7 helicase-like C-terminal domain-containing protein n=1 Tax=Fusarium longipes TaxID=694270 RepID=A0A395SZ84_9HYPO|nr:hypothetical protein FLONG3_4593 [Fusarium longipes]
MASTQSRCVLLFPGASEEDHQKHHQKCIPSRANDGISVSLTKGGLRLSFLRDYDRSTWSWYGPDLSMPDSTRYHITIDLHDFGAEIRSLTTGEDEALKALAGVDKSNDVHVLELIHKPTKPCSPRVIGFGLPFHGANSTVDGWINQGTRICGVASLVEILRSKQFSVLVKAKETDLRSLVPFYKQTVERFDYGEVQRVSKDSEEQKSQFVCLLEPRDKFSFKHWRAARRALGGDATKLEITFSSSQGVTWEAFHLTFASTDHLQGVDCDRRLPLLLTRPAKNEPGHGFSPISHSDYKGTDGRSQRNMVRFRCHLSLHSDMLRVSAINRLSRPNILPSVMEEDSLAYTKQSIFNEMLIGKGLWELQKEGVNVQVPPIDLFSGIPAELRDACLNRVFEDDRERVRRYFGKLHLGLGLVSGPPGTGKSHLASIIVLLMCFNESIKHVYVAAASNGATDNILERIDGMAQTIEEALSERDHKHLMLLRGYSPGTEVENCTLVLMNKPFKEDTILNHSPWKFTYSLCWWTLRVLGSDKVPRLTANDNAELWNLHQSLSALLGLSSRNPGLSKFRTLVRLARGMEPHSNFLKKNQQDALSKMLCQLMVLVVGCANVVATTPETSASWIYRSFNNQKARAVVFDEAATMFCADGLVVYGNTPRPMVAIGDPKQLSPNLTTAFEHLNGNPLKHDRRHDTDSERRRLKSLPTNRFAGFAKISWLSWFIQLGWPVFHLYTQHRMAHGLFDLSLNTVYQSLKPHFRYSPLCHPNNFDLGLKVEKYLEDEHRIKPSDDNTLQPVFFNCSVCPCREYPDSLSRLNPGQADLIAKFLVKMIRKLKLRAEDIVVLTPYRANIGAIGRRFRKEKVLKDVEFTSFTRFQGREAQIVVLALCVDEQTGPLFVADEQRLNVALTRQRSSLLIFGDLGTTVYSPDQPFNWDDGQPTRINHRMINAVFRMIRASGRIVYLEGDPSADPDSRWATQD